MSPLVGRCALTVMHVAVSLGGIQLDGLQEVALGLRLLPLGVEQRRYCSALR